MYNLSTVSGAAKEVLKAALKLGPKSRAAVAEELLESLEGSGYGKLSPAWEAEIDRRIADIEAGRVQTIPAEQVHAEIDQDLREIRRRKRARR
jgi:putative addiction module component (TIGR02574 family)